MREEAVNDQMSRSTLLKMQVAGLTITALTVLAIAGVVQLLLRGLSLNAFQPGILHLSYVFAFYILSLFLSVGSQQRPDHAPFALAKVLLQGAFLSLGWLLFSSRVHGSWLLLAIACSVVVNGNHLLFARLRTALVEQVLKLGLLTPALFVERLFFVRTPVYHAMPIGAAVGTLVGRLVTAEAMRIAWYAVASAFLAVAICELVLLVRGARAFGQQFTSSSEQTASLTVVTVGDGCRLELAAPARGMSAHQYAEAAAAVSSLRRVLVLSQLERVAMLGFSAFVALHILCGHVPQLLFLALPFGLFLLFAYVPFALGQSATRSAVVAATPGEQQASTRALLHERVSSLPSMVHGAALLVAVSVAALAYGCLAPFLGAGAL